MRPREVERVIIHISWILSQVRREFERSALSREVRYIVEKAFIDKYAIREIPEIVIEWGSEDKAYIDLRTGRLVIVLRAGRGNRYENIARALIAAIPDLLAPELKAVYGGKLLELLSSHIARSVAIDYQPVVTAINDVIGTLSEEDESFRKLASMLVEIDDRSLLSRVLIPEMVEIAKLRYPHRDPLIDDEVIELINLLYELARGEVRRVPPIIYGKYIRVAFVLVARPEKIERELMPHVNYVKYVLNKYRGIQSIYILAAGRNVVAARYLKMLLETELKTMSVKLVTTEYVYEGRYRDAPRMKLYVGRIKLKLE